MSIASRRRRAFSLVELLVVVTIIGITTALAAPKIRDYNLNNSLNAAQVDIQSYINRARQAAINRGHAIRFKRLGTQIMVIDSLVTPRDTLGRPRSLGENYGVTLSATRDYIDFDTRGMAIGLSAAVTYTVTKSSRSKVVCTSILGLVGKAGISCG